MLFDLQSPRRRRVVKFVYGGLALLLGAGLIAGTFGSGGGNGSILDTIFGGGGNSAASTAFDDQIKQAEQKLAVNAQDQQALISLVTLHVQKGQQELNVDSSTGRQSPTVDSTNDFQKAADSWAAYLKTKPSKPSPAAASQVAQGYLFLAESSTTAAAADANLKGAADAQKIAAAQSPTLGSLSTLAQYLYFAGDTAAGDQAGKEALAKATTSPEDPADPAASPRSRRSPPRSASRSTPPPSRRRRRRRPAAPAPREQPAAATRSRTRSVRAAAWAAEPSGSSPSAPRPDLYFLAARFAHQGR